MTARADWFARSAREPLRLQNKRRPTFDQAGTATVQGTYASRFSIEIIGLRVRAVDCRVTASGPACAVTQKSCMVDVANEQVAAGVWTLNLGMTAQAQVGIANR